MSADGAPTGYALGPDEGEAIWYFGGLMIVRAAGEQTGERFTLHEHVSFGGMATPLHVQPLEDETFYMLDGEMTVFIDGEPRRIVSGGSAFIPRGTPHALRMGPGSPRYLVLNTPAGHERFFRAVGEPARERTLPPSPEVEPDMGMMAAAAADAGFEILGPPPDGPG